MSTMKAVRIHEDAPRPAPPGAGELLVTVRAVAVNPLDWRLRAGLLKDYRPRRLPFIPGWDVSGIVEAVGTGVTAFKKGAEVYASPDTARDGAYAEYVIVKESEAALKPQSIDHVHAAAIPVSGLTAWQALFEHGQLEAGQKILIHGAAGGVRSIAVQFAKWKRARVVGTASGRNQMFLRELGVDEPIDYESTRFDEVVHNVDVVLDTIGGDTQRRSWKVLKRGGVVVSLVGPPSAEEAARHGVRAESFGADASPTQLAEIAKLVDAGSLKPVVDTLLPLSDARHPHEMSERGHVRGKIVLTV
jgi:NADPH:quinone reductase-like Zn-dependent oxidoreductase